MARDRRRDRRAAVPRRLLSRVLALALAAVLAAGAVLYGLASAESVAPSRALWSWSLPAGYPQPRVPAGNPMSRGKVAIGPENIVRRADGVTTLRTFRGEEVDYVDPPAGASELHSE